MLGFAAGACVLYAPAVRVLQRHYSSLEVAVETHTIDRPKTRRDRVDTKESLQQAAPASNAAFCLDRINLLAKNPAGLAAPEPHTPTRNATHDLENKIPSMHRYYCPWRIPKSPYVALSHNTSREIVRSSIGAGLMQSKKRFTYTRTKRNTAHPGRRI